MAGTTARRSARGTAAYRCSECGWQTAKWVGRCGECQAWGSVGETGGVTARTSATTVERPAVPIGEVDLTRAAARPTGVAEFDRVLGGGLVPGAVVLVAGEPGIGKSTLLLDVAGRAARSGEHGERRVLYVSGEESAAQVRSRAERIEAMARTLYLASETDLGTLLGQVEQVEPELLVVDSVQTISSAEVEGSAGNVAQVREVAASLIQVAKARGIAVLLVGHVTKDGSIAGPRVLEHLVDVVVQFEGDRHSRLRLVRAVKNRYGPTDEVGCFDLSDVGIVGLTDPSGLFLSGAHGVGPRHLRHRDPRGASATGHRGAGAGHRLQPGHPAPRHQRARRRPGQHGPGRPRQAGPGAHRRQRRLPLHRRRGAAHRARRRPGRHPGPGGRHHRPAAARGDRRVR